MKTLINGTFTGILQYNSVFLNEKRTRHLIIYSDKPYIDVSRIPSETLHILSFFIEITLISCFKIGLVY